jgi:peptidoglycan/xylan/chitin deacetylase (PgdA/CDA1 family)
LSSRVILALTIGLAAALAGTTLAQAADCPRPNTLGTWRVLEVDAAQFPRVGLKSFPDTLPLQDKEIVLTFDDGPHPPATTKVLQALAQECVRATFFLVGKSASEYPDVVRRTAAAGHTIGHHTWSHPSIPRMSLSEATNDIDRGIAADEKALHGVASTTPSTPFFRFPGFESTPETLDLLQSRGIVVFGADFWASDWEKMTPKQELDLLIGRLNETRKGILLLHDAQPRTAAMLPDFLRYLRENGYHIVHLVPKGAAKEPGMTSAKAP